MALGICIGIILSISILLVAMGAVRRRSQAAEQERIRFQTRLAQHRLQQIGQRAMQAMLEEARRHHLDQ